MFRLLQLNLHGSGFPLREGWVCTLFLPHEFLGRIYHNAPTVWSKHIRGPDGVAASFWRALEGSPVIAGHPWLNPKYLHQTLPLGMHGDAGAISKNDSLMVISWNSSLERLEGVDSVVGFSLLRSAKLTWALTPLMPFGKFSDGL